MCNMTRPHARFGIDYLIVFTRYSDITPFSSRTCKYKGRVEKGAVFSMVPASIMLISYIKQLIRVFVNKRHPYRAAGFLGHITSKDHGYTATFFGLTVNTLG